MGLFQKMPAATGHPFQDVLQSDQKLDYLEETSSNMTKRFPELHFVCTLKGRCLCVTRSRAFYSPDAQALLYMGIEGVRLRFVPSVSVAQKVTRGLCSRTKEMKSVPWQQLPLCKREDQTVRFRLFSACPPHLHSQSALMVAFFHRPRCAAG